MCICLKFKVVLSTTIHGKANVCLNCLYWQPVCVLCVKSGKADEEEGSEGEEEEEEVGAEDSDIEKEASELYEWTQNLSFEDVI